MSSGHGCGGGEGGGVGGGAEEGSGVNKGPWTAAEDAILMEYVKKHGAWNWSAVQKKSGLSRCGKSCRLRWANHLRPNLKKGALSPDEECLILQLHSELGNKWARMAAQLPGRTDNEIKNYWNTRIKRRRRQGLPLYPPGIQRQAAMHATPRPPAPSRSLLLLDHAAAPVPPPPMGFDAQSFVQDAGYNGGHHQVQYFLPPGAIDRLNAGGFSLPFPSHGQMHPFLHQDFGGAGMANLNLPPDAGVSIKLELPSGQNPDPGSSSLIYEMPATDLDAFVLHSGDGGRAGYLLDPRLGKASLVGHPPPMSLNASSSNAVHWTGSGVGDSNSDHPLPPEISHKEEEGLTTLFNIMPVATIAARVPPPPMGFYAQSFVQDAGYNDGHHQVQYFLPPGAIDRLNAGGVSLPFPSHGQMEPFLHQDFGGAGMANLNLTPDAGVSIKLELPSSQNPDPGSPSLIYEIPATDLDAFVLHSGDGGRAGYLLDPRLGKASLVGHPPPMSLNPSSSNAVHWTGSGGGDSNSDHPLPPGISHKEEEELTTLFNIMPAATTTGVGEWYSDSGEACNSALTEDVDIGLDVQQLASSVPTSAAAETSPDPTGAGDKE